MKFLFVLLLFSGLSSVSSLTLECAFQINYENRYACLDVKLNIAENNMQLTNVSGNHLIGKTLKNVYFIGFQSSRMRYLPQNLFSFLENVRVYDVRGLQLVGHYLQRDALIRGDFIGGKSLHTIVIAGVNLNHLKPYVFEGADRLSSLWLQNNYIYTVDKHAFQTLSNLKSLTLNNNFIKFLDKDTFASLESLRVLMMMGNSLQEISSSLFVNLKHLYHVSFGYNDLEVIDDTILNEIPDIYNFGLTGNVCIDLIFIGEQNALIQKVQIVDDLDGLPDTQIVGSTGSDYMLMDISRQSLRSAVEIKLFKELVRNCTRKNILKDKVTDLQDTNARLSEQVEMLRAENSKLKINIAVLEEKVTMLEVTNKNVTTSKAKLSNQLASANIEIKHLKNKSKNLTELYNQQSTTVNSLTNQVSTLKKGKNQLAEKLKTCDNDKQALKERVTGLEITNNNWETVKTEITKKLASANTEIATLKNKNKDVTSSLNQQLVTVKLMKEKVSALNLEKNHLAGKLKECGNERETLKGKYSNLEATAKRENQNLRKRNNDLSNQVSNLNWQKNKLNSKLKECEEDDYDVCLFGNFFCF